MVEIGLLTIQLINRTQETNMNRLAKNLLVALVTGSFFVAGAINAKSQTIVKTIELRADDNQETAIHVTAGEDAISYTFSKEELEDPAFLEDALSELDDDTRTTVLNALQGIKTGDGKLFIQKDGENLDLDLDLDISKDAKVMVLHKGDGSIANLSGNFDHGSIIKQYFKVKHGDKLTAGHSGLITKLIEGGEFTPEQLDKIQAALDNKR
jgi:hypothetical protein